MMSDIHTQLCDLLDREGAVYRVIEHEPEGKTDHRQDSRKSNRTIHQIHCDPGETKEEGNYILSCECPRRLSH